MQQQQEKNENKTEFKEDHAFLMSEVKCFQVMKRNDDFDPKDKEEDLRLTDEELISKYRAYSEVLTRNIWLPRRYKVVDKKEVTWQSDDYTMLSEFNDEMHFNSRIKGEKDDEKRQEILNELLDHYWSFKRMRLQTPKAFAMHNFGQEK
ncbi:hypothetical protein PS6_011535 [Mucor atramentarius]